MHNRVWETTVCVAIAGISLSAAGCASPGRHVHAGAEVAPDEEAAILAAVDRFFDAMAARDIDRYAAAVTEDGMTYSQRLVDGEWQLRRRTNRQQIDMLDDADDSLGETLWDPTVLIRGPMAVVWAPYEFRINNNVSHCGIDVFEMLKIDDHWVVGNAMWTVEPHACGELKARSEH